MFRVSSADRVVFPEIGRTKADVVAYYEQIAERALPHLIDRPLSIKRYPKGLAGPGFFQKNVPAHYPPTIDRLEIPRSQAASRRHRDPEARERSVTLYPVLRELEHLPYVANQGAIELHVPTARASDLMRPDRLVIDLDPPPGALALVRRAALITREVLGELGLPTVPVATGSKGYHLVACLQAVSGVETLAVALHQLATLLVARHPAVFTTVFRVAERGERVFVDWLRNHPLATVVAPYSLRARPLAPVATPLAWTELETTDPDAFTLAALDALLDRPDPLAELARQPSDPRPLIGAVNEAFARAGLHLETFDRFRS